MEPDDPEVCICNHVPLGKLVKHYRLNHPRVASQMSECYGAGTGCGWCIPFLEQLFDQLQRGEEPMIDSLDEDYLGGRAHYRETGRRDLSEESEETQEKDERTDGKGGGEGDE